MRINSKLITAIALLSGAVMMNPVIAQETATAQVKSETVIEKIAVSAPNLAYSINPTIMWERFLSSHGLKQGWNKLPSGDIFISKGESTVGKPLSNRKFVGSRNIAFEKAMVFAQDSMASELSSTSSMKIMYQLESDSNELPPSLETAKGEISIFDRIEKLTTEALDAQINKYDPSWSSKGKSEAEINAKIVETREQFEKVMAEKTSLWLQGASNIFNTEGPDSQGMYTVIVGLAWSPTYSKIVTNLIDKDQPAPTGKPAAPIIDQINAKLVKDPQWLTKQLGLKVMRDETGARSLVSFYNVDRVGAKRGYQKNAVILANSQMAAFVSTKLAASQLLKQAETQDYNADNTITAYNQEKFKHHTDIASKEVNFNGRTTIKTWEGVHPVATDRKVYGVVTVWSPATRDKALATIKMIKDSKEIQHKAIVGSGTASGKTDIMPTGPQAVTGFNSGAFSLDDF